MARVKTDQMEHRARDLLHQPYTRVIIPDLNGYSAEILEFPGCFASGSTAEEAYRNLEGAAASWLEAELAKGASIPSPLKHYEASGAYLWRPPRSLHARAIAVAAMEGVSLNQYLTTVVAENLGARAAQAQPTSARGSAVIFIGGGRSMTVKLGQLGAADVWEGAPTETAPTVTIQ